MDKKTEWRKPIVRGRFVNFFIIIILLFIAILSFFLMRGKTRISGKYPENITNTSMTCTNPSIQYPIFKRRTENGEAKVNIIFSGEQPSDISLTYSVFTKDVTDTISAEAVSHADMNISFAGRGLSPDSYNANYSKLNNKMQMTLYASGTSIDQAAAQYFFIDLQSGKLPNTIDEYRKNYESKQFICSQN